MKLILDFVENVKKKIKKKASWFILKLFFLHTPLMIIVSDMYSLYGSILWILRWKAEGKKDERNKGGQVKIEKPA